MRLSIVVPAYNEEAVIGPCLDAITRAVVYAGLGPDEYEIVVVNNASTDRTKEIALSHAGVRVVDEMRKGLTRAKQAGYMATQGDILAHPDADTLMPERWLSIVVGEFEKDPTLLAVTGPYIYYDLPPLKRLVIRFFIFCAYLSHIFNHFVLGMGAMIQGGNYAVRRSVLDAIGGYDTSIEFYGEDTDLARRISEIGKVGWMWKLYMYSSGRRLVAEGIMTISWRYTINYLSTIFIKKPVTMNYIDIRPDKREH
nr:glycosyltransferase family 2 protein [Candidatus Paceibacterota bacterium]